MVVTSAQLRVLMGLNRLFRKFFFQFCAQLNSQLEWCVLQCKGKCTCYIIYFYFRCEITVILITPGEMGYTAVTLLHYLILSILFFIFYL